MKKDNKKGVDLLNFRRITEPCDRIVDLIVINYYNFIDSALEGRSKWKREQLL